MDERSSRVVTAVLVAVVVTQVVGAILIWTLDAVTQQTLIGLGVGFESALTVEALALYGLLARPSRRGSPEFRDT